MRKLTIVLIGLILLSQLTSCVKKSVVPIYKDFPEYNPNIAAREYYKVWIEAEEDLRKCIDECGCL